MHKCPNICSLVSEIGKPLEIFMEHEWQSNIEELKYFSTYCDVKITGSMDIC